MSEYDVLRLDTFNIISIDHLDDLDATMFRVERNGGKVFGVTDGDHAATVTVVGKYASRDFHETKRETISIRHHSECEFLNGKGYCDGMTFALDGRDPMAIALRNFSAIYRKEGE